MKRILRRLELPLVVVFCLAGSAFLLKMCYLSLVFNSAFGLFFLATFYAYVRLRYNLIIPLALLGLVFVAVQVDALGNYLRLYGSPMGPVQYDEFSHLAVQTLVTPLILWLARSALERFGLRLSFGLVSFFGATTMFSLSAFYEIIELWDEIYFHGQRIWSTHDTANDLQWDFVGIVLGTLLAQALIGWERGRASHPEILDTPGTSV